MTGGEILPIAKVAASAAEKAVDDRDDKAVLLELAAESPSMEAAAESYVRRAAIKQAVRLRVYQPLARFLGISRDGILGTGRVEVAMCALVMAGRI